MAHPPRAWISFTKPLATRSSSATPDLRAEALRPSSRAVCLAYEARLPIACRLPTNPRARRRSRSPLVDGPPMRLCGPPAYEATGSDQHRSIQLRLCSVFRLSQSLDALLRPKPFRPCFMPVTLMGFTPFRAFPSRRSRHASRRSLPSCRCRSVSRPPAWGTDGLLPRSRLGRQVDTYGEERLALRSASGSGTSLESVARRPGVIPTDGSMLSWVFRLFRVLRSPSLVFRFRRTSSHELSSRRPCLPPKGNASPRRWLFGVSIDSSADPDALASSLPS